MSPQIEIALATFQGGLFLTEQLGSLAKQSLQFQRLIVRDDCSSDGTVDLISRASSDGMEVTMLPAEGMRLGASGNFGEYSLPPAHPM